MRRLVMIMTATLVLAGCGGGDDFADEDPVGHAACESMQTVIDQYGEPEVMESLLETGQMAREAETPEIRAAAEPLGGSSELADFTLPDRVALVAACNEHGFDLVDERP